VSLFKQQPNHPYRNLLVSTLIGVFAGSFLYSILLATFHSTSWRQAATLIADSLFTSFIAYVFAAAALMVYALPLMWCCLRMRVAGPAVALAIATLPGIFLLVVGGSYQGLMWIPILISVSTGICFVLLAYRGAPLTDQ
jgi:hypothetical protein